MSTVTMREMLQAGVHFGHQTRYWDPKMEPYLFGQRNKIHIINLEKTLPLYQEATNFIGKQASKKRTILFVGTKRSAQKIIAEEALRCGMPYINRRWLGGLLTNFRTARISINRLKEIEAMQSDGKLERLGKKEQLMLQRELERLNLNLAGIKDMKATPDVLFIIDVGHENIAVNEAVKLKIPVVGIVDSNNSPNNIDYVIPGNDDATRSIALYAKGMADAILEGRQSIAHLGGDGEGDDLIEIDEQGSPVDAPIGKQKIIKKAAKKKMINPESVAPKAADIAQPVTPAEVIHTDDSKSVASAEVIHTDDSKPVTPAEVVHTDDSKPVAPAEVIHADDSKPVTPAETDNKAVTKKKVTKKKKMMNNLDWTREKLEALVEELNARFGIGQFKFHQQRETKTHMSIHGDKPRVNGRIYISPLAEQGWWDVAPYGLSIEKTMFPYMRRDLFKREPNGYKHPPERQAYWRTDDFDKAREAVHHYAKIMIEQTS